MAFSVSVPAIPRGAQNSNRDGGGCRCKIGKELMGENVVEIDRRTPPTTTHVFKNTRSHTHTEVHRGVVSPVDGHRLPMDVHL